VLTRARVGRAQQRVEAARRGARPSSASAASIAARMSCSSRAASKKG
jgi:hypothetical protein